MAYENHKGGPVGLVADADLSTKQHCIVKVSAANKVDVCGAGEMGIGILLNKPDADGKAASIAGVGDCAKVLVGTGDLAAGDAFTAEAGGSAVVAATGDFILGIALEAAADGELCSVYICPQGIAD
jgi:hypothetical protein